MPESSAKKSFETDRICFDRSVWVVYYPTVVKLSDQNKYDPDLIDRCDLEFDIKQTNFKGKGKEFVWYREWGDKPYLKIEMRLRQSRSLNAYFNFNRYFFQKYNMKHDLRLPVIHDDNFLPRDSGIGIEDYLNVYKNSFPSSIIDTFEKNYKRFWPEQYEWLQDKGENPVCKCVTLEVARELSPLSVDDVRNDLFARGVSFSSYNKTEKTLYFGDKPDLEIDYRIDDTVLKANISTWNVKDPYEKIKQGKLYQKSTKLCRFEITLYDSQIDFNSLNPVEDIQFTLDEYADLFGLVLRNETKNYDEMINHIALMHKLDESIISMILKTGISISGNAMNRNLIRSLLRRGLILRRGRGQYVTNPAFLKLFEGYVKPKEQKEYLPKFL